MKLIRTLNITSDEFYDYLELKLTEDIKKHANKKVNRIEKGIHYSIHGNEQYARIELKLLDYKRGECYKMQMKSYTDETTISYETKETNEGLKVIFEQNILSEKNKKRNIVFQKFSETVYLSQMSRTIYDIESAIIKKREN